MKKIAFLFLLILSTFILSAEEKSLLGVLVGHYAPVSALAASPSGKFLASASEDKTIRIWQVSDNSCEVILAGHLEPVWSISYSPDGAYLASGSDDNTVRIWNTEDGKCIKILTGHTRYVVSVAYSPDGKYIASGSIDKSVKIWRISDSECVSSFSQHTDPVVSVSYSPNSKFVAAASGQIIKIWQISNGTCVGSLTGHSDPLAAVTYSPSGKYLASAGGQTIKVWRAGNGECIDTLTGHETDIRGLSYSPDGKNIASCDTGGKVKIWDVETGNNVKTLLSNGEASSLCFSRDGKLIFLGNTNGTIEVRKFSVEDAAPKQVAAAANTGKKPVKKEITVKKPAPAFEEKPAQIVLTQPAYSTANISAGGEQNPEAAGTAADALQQQTTVSSLEQAAESQPGTKKVSSGFLMILFAIVLFAVVFLIFFFIALSKAKYAALPKRIAKHIAEGKIDQATELFIKYQNGFLGKKPNIKKLPPEVLFKIYFHGNMIDDLFKEDYPVTYLISFTKLLIEVKKYEKAYELSHKFSLQELAAGEIIAMYTAIGKANDITPGIIPISYYLEYAKTTLEQGNKNEAFRMVDKYKDHIFDGKTFGKETYIFAKEHTHSVSSVCFTPDGQHMATASFDKTIKIWQIKSKKCVKTLSDNADWIYSISYSPNGKYLIAGLGNGAIKIWSADKYECLKHIEAHKDSVMSVTFSQDGFFFLSGSADSLIKMWDVETGECLKLLKGHTGWVKTATFSPDGKFVISGSADNTLKIWNIATSENVMTLQGHTWGGVNSLSFSNDNKYLASASDDKTIKIWQVGNYECIQTLQAHTNNVLSAAFSDDNNYIISGSADKTIKIWQLPNFECIKTIEGNSNSVMSVSFSPGSQYIAAGNADQTVKVWDLKSILMIDENVIGEVFEIYEKSGNIDQLCSYVAKSKVKPKIYNLLSEFFYKANDFDRAQAVLKAKQNFYSTSTPAGADAPAVESTRPQAEPPQQLDPASYETQGQDKIHSEELQDKFSEELSKSLKSLENENKEN